MRALLLFFSILLLNSYHAQNNYIITATNDTVKCEINLKLDRVINNLKVTIENDEVQWKNKYKPEELLGFRYNGMKFISAKNQKGKFKFYEVLSEGKLTLLKRLEKETTVGAMGGVTVGSYGTSPGGGVAVSTIKELHYLIVKSDTQKIKLYARNLFYETSKKSKKLKPLFFDCESIKAAYAEKPFDMKDEFELIHIVNYYNNCEE